MIKEIRSLADDIEHELRVLKQSRSLPHKEAIRLLLSDTVKLKAKCACYGERPEKTKR